MMKKALALGLGMAMLLTGLSACAQKGGATSSNSTSSNSTSSNSTSSGSASNSKISITLDMQVANIPQNDPVTYQIVQKFESENPSVTVNLTGEATDDHSKKIQMAAQSGTLPDIFWAQPATAKEMAKAGNIIDLTDFLNKYPGAKSKITSSLLKGTNDGGFQFGLPYQTLVTGFWYNKALFKQYNVTEPTAGTTFDQLLTMAKVFKSKNVVTISQGAKDPFSVWAFLTGLSRYGYESKISDILAGKQKFDNTDFVNYFTKIQELQEAGAFPSNVTTMSYYDAEQMFLTGKSAMFDAGVWEAPKIDKSLGANAGFWWGPAFSDGVGNQKVSMIVPSAPFCVSAKLKSDAAKLDAVYKFLNFYYSDEAAQIMVKNETMPVITYSASVDSSKYPAFAALMVQVSNKEWTSPSAQPDLIVSTNVQNAMYDSIYGVIDGNYSPKAALDKIDAAVSQQ